MLRVGVTLILSFVGFYLLMVAVLYLCQSRFIYFPAREMDVDPGMVGLEFNHISFKTKDGLSLSAWYIPAENSSRVLLFCHGNAGNISHRLESILLFHQLGLNVFIYDYRGFGASEGRPSEHGTYQDVAGAWIYLRNERHFKSKEIILFGRSLGGSVASWLACREDPLALIIESSYQSLAAVAAKHYPLIPVRLLLRFRYNTSEYIKKVTCPIMVIHSQDDEIIPFAHGKTLLKLANEPKTFLAIRGSHNEGFSLSMPVYERGIREFLKSL